MGAKSKSTVVQVPVDAEFLARIDRRARVLRESRAAFVRAACQERLRTLEDAEKEHRYEAAYLNVPERTAWAGVSARLLSLALTKEKW